MKLAEIAGYSWCSESNPTYYNDDSRYTESSDIVTLHEDKTLTRCCAPINPSIRKECSLKNVIHLEVGDMVSIRGDLGRCRPDVVLPITNPMIAFAGQVTYITQVSRDPIFNRLQYALAIDGGKTVGVRNILNLYCLE